MPHYNIYIGIVHQVAPVYGAFCFFLFFVCVCVMVLMVCGCLNADEQPAAMQRGNPASSFNHPLLAGVVKSFGTLDGADSLRACLCVYTLLLLHATTFFFVIYVKIRRGRRRRKKRKRKKKWKPFE
jgi:hypothetical protein